MSGACLVLILLFLPETCRNIVGNGTYPPPTMNKSPISIFAKSQDLVAAPCPLIRPTLRLPNPFPCLRIVAHKDTTLVLVANAIFYNAYCCIQASLSTLLARIYGLNPVQVGFCYLAYGIGCAIASYAVGKVIDRDYRIVARKIGHTIDKIKGDDLTTFPIERARLRSVFYLVNIAAGSTLAYGWTVHAKTHIAAPMIFQFICGVTVTGTFNVRSHTFCCFLGGGACCRAD